MRRIPLLSAAALMTALNATSSSAASEMAPQSQAAVPVSELPYLMRERFGLKPVAGAVFYDDFFGDGQVRASLGLVTELNFLPPNARGQYLGLSSGLIFSHLGAPGADFFGSGGNAATAGSDANILLIPVNLKYGFMLGPSVRLSFRTGGNVVYRSVTLSTGLSAGDLNVSEDGWDMYPNFGTDLEVGIFFLRPDWTITPRADIFMGSLGVNIPLG